MTSSAKATGASLSNLPVLLAVAGALFFSGYADAAQERSRAVRAEFERLVPCPKPGPGTCASKGYQADHRLALVCGGKDEMANLQWLTVAEHKAKTAKDVRECRLSR